MYRQLKTQHIFSYECEDDEMFEFEAILGTVGFGQQ
jgi:hypothetical protein